MSSHCWNLNDWLGLVTTGTTVPRSASLERSSYNHQSLPTNLEKVFNCEVIHSKTVSTGGKNGKWQITFIPKNNTGSGFGEMLFTEIAKCWETFNGGSIIKRNIFTENLC